MRQSDNQPTRAIDRRRGISLLFISLLCLGMGQTLFFSLLPPMARGLGLSEIQVSSIFTLSAVLWVIMSPIWGWFSDKWGRKPVILLGLFGFGASTGGFGLVLWIGQKGFVSLMVLYALLIGMRAVFGFFGSGAPTAAQAYIADRTSRKERTKGVAAIGAAFGMGTIVGPGFAAALVSVHLLAPFFSLSLFALSGVVLLAIFLPERNKPQSSKATLRPRLSVFDLRIRPFLFMGVVVSLLQAAVMQIAAFFIMDTLHIDAIMTAQIVGIGMMSMAMSTLFAQLVIIPQANLSVRNLLFWGTVVSTFGIGLLIFPMSSGLFVFALTIQGLGFGLLRPAVAAGASLCVDENEQGAAAGLIGSTAAVGIIFVPIIIMPTYLILPTGPFWIAFFMSFLLLWVIRMRGVDSLETRADKTEIEAEALTHPSRHS